MSAHFQSRDRRTVLAGLATAALLGAAGCFPEHAATAALKSPRFPPDFA